MASAEHSGMQFFEGTLRQTASYTAVWNEDRVWFWGGYRGNSQGLNPSDQGAIYVPEDDRWEQWPTSAAASGVSTPRAEHFAFMDHGAMVVLGGLVSSLRSLGDSIFHGDYDRGGASLEIAQTGTVWTPIVPPPSVPASALVNFVLHDEARQPLSVYEFGLLADTGNAAFGVGGPNWKTVAAPELLSRVGSERAENSGMFFGSPHPGENVEPPRITGGTFDFASETWTPLTSTGAPSPRTGASLANGIVWGGTLNSDSSTSNEGFSYDLQRKVWSRISTVGAPSPRRSHVAVAIGRRMLIFGGENHDQMWLNDGGIYDPESDSWTPLPTDCAPSPVQYPIALWTHQGFASAPERYWKQNAVIVWGTSTEDPLSGRGNGALLILPDDWR